MYGWRARFGLIIPHVNVTMEPEFHRLAPPGVTFHASRMRIPELTVDGLIQMGREVERAADEVAELDARVTIFGCTSGSFVKGRDHDRELIERIESRTGRPAVATSGAAVAAMKALKLRRIVLATPYPDDINERQCEFLEANGLEVVAVRGLGIRERLPHLPLADTPVTHIGLQPPEVAFKLAHGAFHPDADGVFISCTGLRTIEVIDALEEDLGVPVISSNQATFWAALQTAGIRIRIPGYGRLLADPPALPQAATV